MKILYADQIYYKEHRYFDNKTIQNLSKVCDLTVLSPDNWYKQIDGVKYVFGAVDIYKKQKTHLNSIIGAVKNSFFIARKIKELKPEVVILGEYEILVYFLLGRLFKSRIILIHHNNLDQLGNRIKRFMFGHFKNKVFHCVLEPYIKKWLVDNQFAPKDKIVCWPHPMERNHRILKRTPIFDCVALSNSNDEDIIQKIIDCEKEKHIFEKKNQHIVLRSKITEFDDGYLKVLNGWIEDKDYEDFISQTRSIMVTVPTSFNNRVSASIIEAFDQKIPVIGNESALFKFYRDKYPSICYILNLDRIDELISEINIDDMQIDFEAFRENHCDLTIQRTMKEDLEKINS